MASRHILNSAGLDAAVSSIKAHRLASKPATDLRLAADIVRAYLEASEIAEEPRAEEYSTPHRDQIALAVLPMTAEHSPPDQRGCEDAARWAYGLADAMEAARLEK